MNSQYLGLDSHPFLHQTRIEDPDLYTTKANASSSPLWDLPHDADCIQDRGGRTSVSRPTTTQATHVDRTSLRDDDEFADLEIKCGSSSFRVHRAIICRQSKFFALACKKGHWKEGRTGVIELATVDEDEDGDNPNTAKLMIDYFYDSRYDASGCKTWYEYLDRKSKDSAAVVVDPDEQSHRNKRLRPSTPLDLDAGVGKVAMSDNSASAHSGRKIKHSSSTHSRRKLELVPKLPISSSPSESKTGASDVENKNLIIHAELYALGSKYQIPDLQAEVCKNFALDACKGATVDNLVQALETAFTKTLTESAIDSRFRSLVRETCVKNATRLIDHDDFITLVASTQGLALELFREAIRQRSSESTTRIRRCAGCGSLYSSACAGDACRHEWEVGGRAGYLVPWNCDIRLCGKCARDLRP